MSRDPYVPCQTPFDYPMRWKFSFSSPSVTSIGSRFKSLMKWRTRVAKSSEETSTSKEQASTANDANFSSTIEEISRINLSSCDDEAEFSDLAIQSLEDTPFPGDTGNLVNSDLISSSFEQQSEVASFSTLPTDESIVILADLNAGSSQDASSHGTVRLSDITSNSTNYGVNEASNFYDSLITTTDSIEQEINTTLDSQETATLPSRIVGVQIQGTSTGLRIFDLLPVLILQDGTNSGSDEQYTDVSTTDYSNSASTNNDSSENTETTTNDMSTSMSGGGFSATGIFEIVATTIDMDTRQDYNENEFVRPYYDPSVKCGNGLPVTGEGIIASGVNANEGIGVGSGMDCMPLRPGPFHYLINEQAKSLVALQELQNEVGALLEFRDLVIETFPNLRHKMAVSAASSAVVATSAGSGASGNSPAGGPVHTSSNDNTSVLMSPSNQQGSHIPLPLSSQSLTSRRIVEWEPGKVRRRVAQSRETDSTSSLPRSRSNSHSGGCSSNNKQHSATVQDSGFSTETSSKDSASTATARPQSPSSRPILDEAEDELWNLLDVIHRKGVRLREEVESLQGRLASVAPEDLDDVPSDIIDAVRNVTVHSIRERKRLDHSDLDENFLDDDDDDELALLRREKLQLLDKVAELEAETIAGRARTQELQSQLAALVLLKTGLEDRLKIGLSAVDEISGDILTPAPHKITPMDVVSTNVISSPRGSNVALEIGGKGSAFASVITSAGSESKLAAKSRFRTRTIKKNVLQRVANQVSTTNRSYEDIFSAVASQNSSAERRARLGALDSVLVSPTRMPLRQLPRADVDTLKIAAILKEKEPLELQRHLITTTVHNQVLQKQLNDVQRSSECLSERLGKVNEENEDLRFQLAERNIELEGTRARVRVLERLQQRPATEMDADDESELALHQLSNGTMDTTNSNSSTESSREPLVNLQKGAALKPSPRRRPSRIPLPGASKATAPKPPIIHRSRCGYDSTSQNNARDSLGKQQQTSNGSPPSSANSNRLKSTRDSSRESLNKSISLNKSQSINRSLSRSFGSSNNNNGGNDNNNKNSLGRATHLNSFTKPRDSLESNSGCVQAPPSTPPRRPPAPTRRSQSQAPISSRSVVNTAASADQDYSGKSIQSSDPPTSWLSTTVSIYPDSLDIKNESTCTASTKIEFIIGSPTRKGLFKPTPWSQFFDSIDMPSCSGKHPTMLNNVDSEGDSLEYVSRTEDNY